MKDNIKVQLDKKSIKRLLFWSHVGLLNSQGGAYSKDMPSLIVNLMLRFNIKPREFCCFYDYPNNVLAKEVAQEYSKRFGYIV